jgi:ABC-2 type transport system permease protein
MNKILVIAWREFVSTIWTKGFIAGLLLPPIIGVVGIGLLPLLMNQKPPSVAGHIAVIDESGLVAERLSQAFSAEQLRARRAEKFDAARAQVKDKLGVDPMNPPGAPVAIDPTAMMPEPEPLEVRVLDQGTDVEAAKAPILEATGREQSDEGSDARLALIVVPKGAVLARPASTTPADASASNPPADPAPDATPTPRFDKYELFVAPRLDPEVQGDIRDQTARAIVDARLESEQFDVATIRALIERPEGDTKAVTREGERKTSQVAAFLIPAAFMFLLWISVFTAGQYLLSGTIEEKSNRVMEVLLSAASPMQLMLGKIFGKGAVGALILVLYGGVGLAAMVKFSLDHLVAWHTFLFVIAYFAIAYFSIACVMAAVGAAVTDVTEAQSLIGPIMVVLVIPMMLWMPILRNPNSVFSQVCSFVPLINPFVMVLRLCGSEPIPMWQVPATLVVGLITVVVMAWVCAKVFRIGVLMYGKPPNLAALVRWVRMA